MQPRGSACHPDVNHDPNVDHGHHYDHYSNCDSCIAVHGDIDHPDCSDSFFGCLYRPYQQEYYYYNSYFHYDHHICVRRPYR